MGNIYFDFLIFSECGVCHKDSKSVYIWWVWEKYLFRKCKNLSATSLESRPLMTRAGNHRNETLNGHIWEPWIKVNLSDTSCFFVIYWHLLRGLNSRLAPEHPSLPEITATPWPTSSYNKPAWSIYCHWPHWMAITTTSSGDPRHHYI